MRIARYRAFFNGKITSHHDGVLQSLIVYSFNGTSSDRMQVFITPCTHLRETHVLLSALHSSVTMACATDLKGVVPSFNETFLTSEGFMNPTTIS